MYKKNFKRPLDLIAATTMLLVLLPVIALTAVISAICHNMDIIFIQNRIGKGYKNFKVIKFKTMTDKKDKNGELLADKDRETAFGHFMRRYSLDELLQLVNVIKGDMSLIGPRPLIEPQVASCNENQLRRFEVRPGITGLAQVCGRNGIPFARRFKYDVWYVKNLSFALDMTILWLTAKAVLGIDSSRNIIDYDPLIEQEN